MQLDPSGCPCIYTIPCHPRCTCVDGYSSHGCSRCCRYGSEEQRRDAAVRIAGQAEKVRLECQSAAEQLLKDICSEAMGSECETTCDSYGHDEACRVYSVLNEARWRTREIERLREALESAHVGFALVRGFVNTAFPSFVEQSRVLAILDKNLAAVTVALIATQDFQVPDGGYAPKREPPSGCVDR